jgi:hypothetical protein
MSFHDDHVFFHLSKVSKASESLNRHALDSEDHSALSFTFTDDDFNLLSAATHASECC